MGMISRRRLILSYTIQEVIPNIFTKFQNPRFSSSWEIFDEKQSLHTNPHTHCYWKDKNYTPPIFFVYRGVLYTSYTGGIIMVRYDPTEEMTGRKKDANLWLLPIFAKWTSILIIWMSPFSILGVSCVLIIFILFLIQNPLSSVDPVLRHLIWVCTVCLGPKKGTPG